MYARIAERPITVYEHSAGEINQVLRLPRSRLAVVPNCFWPDPVLDESEISPMRPNLLFIGVHLPTKNLQGLLNAWPIIRERFPHSQLVVRSNLTTEEQASCPEGVVAQGERLERSALDDLIRTASALVWPSFHEEFGLPVLEAMALGTPVLVSRGPALEEVAGEGALLGTSKYCRFQGNIEKPQGHPLHLQIHQNTGIHDFKPRRLSPCRMIRQPALPLSCSAGSEESCKSDCAVPTKLSSWPNQYAL